MADVLTAADLAAWLRDPALEENASLVQIMELVNELFVDEWTTPVDPAPARVRLLALSVGARAWVNSPSASNLESTSVSVDDGSTTKRFRSPARFGVYLTSDEVAALNGSHRSRSVRLISYGEV
jgi:hypothetical protein